MNEIKLKRLLELLEISASYTNNFEKSTSVRNIKEIFKIWKSNENIRHAFIWPEKAEESKKSNIIDNAHRYAMMHILIRRARHLKEQKFYKYFNPLWDLNAILYSHTNPKTFKPSRNAFILIKAMLLSDFIYIKMYLNIYPLNYSKHFIELCIQNYTQPLDIIEFAIRSNYYVFHKQLIEKCNFKYENSSINAIQFYVQSYIETSLKDKVINLILKTINHKNTSQYYSMRLYQIMLKEIVSYLNELKSSLKAKNVNDHKSSNAELKIREIITQILLSDFEVSEKKKLITPVLAEKCIREWFTTTQFPCEYAGIAQLIHGVKPTNINLKSIVSSHSWENAHNKDTHESTLSKSEIPVIPTNPIHIELTKDDEEEDFGSLSDDCMDYVAALMNDDDHSDDEGTNNLFPESATSNPYDNLFALNLVDKDCINKLETSLNKRPLQFLYDSLPQESSKRFKMNTNGDFTFNLPSGGNSMVTHKQITSNIPDNLNETIQPVNLARNPFQLFQLPEVTNKQMSSTEYDSIPFQLFNK